MALSIDKGILELSTEVICILDTQKFGPRQMTSFKRMLTTGVMRGYSMPARLARKLREDAKLPWVCFNRFNSVEWANVPADNDDFFDRLTAGAVAAQMLIPPQTLDASQPRHYSYRNYEAEAIKETLALAAARAPKGNVYYISDHCSKTMSKMKLGDYSFDIPTKITLDILKGESL